MVKRTLRSLRSTPKTVLDITASLPVGFAFLEVDTGKGGRITGERITEWNKKAELLTGLKRRQMIGKSPNAIFPNTVSPSLFDQLKGVYARGRTLHLRGLDLQVRKKTRTLDLSAWKLDKGIGLLLEETRTEEANDEDFSQSVNILDSITDAFFLVDKNWRFAYLSPKSDLFLEKLGMRGGDLIGKNMWEVVPGTHDSRGSVELRKALENRVEVEFEEFYKPLKSWFEVHAHPLGEGLSVYVRDITRRKLAETAFLKLSNAVEQSADAVFVTNLEGTIEYVNPAFEEVTGFKRSEVLGKTPGLLKSDHHNATFFRKLWDQVLSGETFRTTIVNTRKNGEKYFADETITPVRDEKGSITHFVATLRDITDRKRTEESLRKSEERFRALIENSSDGIALLKADGTIVYTGPSTSRILGYRDENFTGLSIFEFIHPDDRNGIEIAFTGLAKIPGTINLFQFRMKHRDGTWRWIEATGNNLLLEAGVQAMVLNYRDITDRKSIEEALRKSEIEYRNLFDLANDAIFIFEPHGELILEANNKACELYGFTKEELLGMSLKMITKDVARGEEQIQQLLRHQSGRNFETVHFNKEGKPMEMLVNSSVVEYAGRTAIMSISRDITELRRLEHQLRQAQKMESIGTLAGGIAHDFNNILSIILGYTSLMRRGKIEGPKVQESIDTITKAAQRGAMLVKQILTFARKTDVVFESVKLNDLIVDLANLLGETFPKTIRFEMRLGENLPAIIADANQLHQIFINLCVNARDAMSNGGTLTIATDMTRGTALRDRFHDVRQSEYVHVQVTDTGSGMDEKTRSRIFEPFFTTKGHESGTGLGLAVVYGIVNNHHGFIDVESTVGTGTTFHLFFPIQMRSFEALQQVSVTTEEIPGGDETVLVVEDEIMLQSLVKTLLEGHGYRVFTARDGTEAVDTYRRLRDEIHLVLTDIGLPKMNGWDVCRQIMEMNPKANVVLASGYLDPNAKSDLKDSHAKDFIHKPYLPEDVLRRIRDVLDGK